MMPRMPILMGPTALLPWCRRLRDKRNWSGDVGLRLATEDELGEIFSAKPLKFLVVEAQIRIGHFQQPLSPPLSFTDQLLQFKKRSVRLREETAVTV